jgi:polysaccharide deacetylase family protein (PEP-CTERM system associated)
MEKSNFHNVITIDLEDWFHGLDPDRRRWDNYERRARQDAEILLGLFRECGSKATFFVLGDVALKSPDLVKDISDEGHEIGSHGMYHQFIYRQKPEEFREDIRRSLDLLTSIIDRPVKSYRAPYFSITKESYWALEILREEGIEYDSSIFPVRNPRYGIPGASRRPFQIVAGLWEWPVATVPSFLGNIPVGGGFYFRFWPYPVTKFALRRIERKREPMLLYFHPWEFDPHHPRVRAGSRFSSLRHYFNLDKTLNRLRKIMVSREYTTLSEGIRKLIGSNYETD